ncbi:DUF262 domain-containing HNH endonuclease family protein [Modestobacter sp. VKM Ac-2979]|uniref:DUF262 domain-containing protein n=1 Tax=unclassified Modestobacter TaxID=2643866 RepID=UPI0022AB80B0|nr:MULTISPECIES: DUF262 domain-containing HNH endonuclease family protein [unclassified Modestobacter]MCZ2813160.1 DUF262 domain-containing HNH endonuclease family protein [Modestobacter sp. VKM Ac-2979]MCZ2842811.1 DUF262 domain-containing HNH endonuclease family protein [Modestobacter sp. VKM Ac-2980]
MDAKTYPLQDILKPERRYIIPTFQRDYEWTLDGQWRLLFEDLETTTERLLDVRTGGEDVSKLKAMEQTISPHFLGAIVCASLPFATGGVALRSVIDGQQRLTTVQLLIRGLLDVLVETDSDRTKSVRRMLFNPDDVIESPEEVYKLWPRRKDRELWPVALGDALPCSDGGFNHLYLDARKYFSQASRAFAMSASGAVDPARLVALADAVSSLFKLVVIDLDDNDDAQVIFEVLNGRQTPLSAIDLVKNLLFLRGELAEEDVDKLYDKHWAQFDDRWWKQEVGRGHAQRGRRDVLLSVWLTAATGSEANVGHLYREARTYLNDGPKTEEVLEQLSTFATAYQAIYDAAPVADRRLVTAYRRIRALDITTAIPLLAWLRTLPSAALPHEDHVRAVQAVESWALRRAYVGWQTRGYGTHLTRVLREAKLASEGNADVADAVVVGLQGGVLDWPNDEAVQEAFLNRRFYDGMAQMRIRLLLGAIDDRLRREDPNEPAAEVSYDDLQIEHIMPQSWGAHWPIVDSLGAIVPKDELDPQWQAVSAERRRTVDRIGNLTLVTGTFNRDLSNLAWGVKKSEFEKQKSLVINYGVAQSDAWNEGKIADRARVLAAAAIQLWPAATKMLSSSS